MWLLYFRFDEQGQVVTMHVRTDSLYEAEQIMKLANKRGFTTTSKLVEYALFRAGSAMQARTVPNFHFYYSKDFIKKWNEAETNQT